MKKIITIGIETSSGSKNEQDSFEAVKEFLTTKLSSLKSLVKFVLFTTLDKNDVDNFFLKNENISMEFCEQKIESNKEKFKDYIRDLEITTLGKAIKFLVDEKIDLLITPAPSEVLVAKAFLNVGTLGNMKPVFATDIFTFTGKRKVLLDLGARLDFNETIYLEFAFLGSELAKALNISKAPKISMLNIGEEETKGGDIRVKAYQLLKKEYSNNFLGNIEPNYVFSSKNEDVIVTDSILGNVFSKTIEGIFSEIYKKFISLTNNSEIIFSNDVKKKILATLNVDLMGFGYVLGIKRNIIKMHGSASKTNFLSAIQNSIDFLENNFIEKLNDEIKRRERKNN